jgi:hypothetical protein
LAFNPLSPVASDIDGGAFNNGFLSLSCDKFPRAFRAFLLGFRLGVSTVKRYLDIAFPVSFYKILDGLVIVPHVNPLGYLLQFLVTSAFIVQIHVATPT